MSAQIVPSNIDPVNDRKFFVAGFFDALCHEDPLIAQTFMGGEVATFAVDHTEPGEFTAPVSYINKIYPLYNRIVEIEIEYLGYELAPRAIQIEWEKLWMDMYPNLPTFMRRDIDEGFYKTTWSETISGADLQAGFDRATERFASYESKLN